MESEPSARYDQIGAGYATTRRPAFTLRLFNAHGHLGWTMARWMDSEVT